LSSAARSLHEFFIDIFLLKSEHDFVWKSRKLAL